MATKRMFSTSVIENDRFLDLPLISQALYLHLCMEADDDGFVDSVRRVLRCCGCNSQDLQCLVDSQFLIPFPSGVVVIRDWLQNNSIRIDRKQPTRYLAELAQLQKTENGSYELMDEADPSREADDFSRPVSDNHAENTCPHECGGKENTRPHECGGKDDTRPHECGEMTTQYSIDKNSIEEERVDQPPRQKYGAYKNVLLSKKDVKALRSQFPKDWQERIERLSEYLEVSGRRYNNYLAVLRMWARKDGPTPEEPEYYAETIIDENGEERLRVSGYD